MKSILFVFAMIVNLSFMAQGTVGKGQMTHEKHTHQAISLKMDIPTDQSKDIFSDFMKERYFLKVDGLGFLQNKDELVIEEVDIPLLSSKKIDLFVDFADDNDDITNVLLAGRFSNDTFFGEDKDPEMFLKLEKLTNDYRLFAQQKYFSRILENQIDLREDMTKSLGNMKKDIEKNRKDIEKNIKENEAMKKEIEAFTKKSEDMKTKLEGVKTEISASKKSLENIK